METLKRRIPLALVFLLLVSSANARDEIHCEGNRSLTKREGEYARKDIWDALPRAADWRALDSLLSAGEGVLSVTVRANGDFHSSTNGWHEAIGTCIKWPADGKGQLWAAAVDVSGVRERAHADVIKSAKWEGPFVRIGPAHAVRRLYFQRLFGTACFETQRGAFCFGPGYIEHGSATFSAELVLDRTEMPAYGFPVVAVNSTTKEERLWVFVRNDEAWQVFDESQFLKRHLIRNASRKPWLTLHRRPGG